MSLEFKLPDIGEGLHEGTLVEWLVTEGQSVALDQPFARVETDKAVVELPAPRAAVVQKLHAAPGETIKVGAVLITFGENGAHVASNGKHAAAVTTQSRTASTTTTPSASLSPIGRMLATPRTRALARKLGVDLAQVAPSGRNGKITDDDVQRTAHGASANSDGYSNESDLSGAISAAPAPMMHIKTTNTSKSTPIAASVGDEPIERIAVSHLRKVIADAMALSTRTAAHVTHVDEADVTDLLDCYDRAKISVAQHSTHKFSVLPYFIRAVVAALKHHPYLNATYDETRNEILVRRYYHIGVAVDAPDGLMVPVIKHADQKDLLQLSEELTDKAERARQRKLNVNELRGGTFTISSLGKLGGAFATPIIHHPEVAIIGLHAIKDRPAVVNGAVVPRKMMYISLSYDHRIIDGAVAARFMDELLQLIQHPDLLMLRL